MLFCDGQHSTIMQHTRAPASSRLSQMDSACQVVQLAYPHRAYEAHRLVPTSNQLASDTHSAHAVRIQLAFGSLSFCSQFIRSQLAHGSRVSSAQLPIFTQLWFQLAFSSKAPIQLQTDVDTGRHPEGLSIPRMPDPYDIPRMSVPNGVPSASDPYDVHSTSDQYDVHSTSVPYDVHSTSVPRRARARLDRISIPPPWTQPARGSGFCPRASARTHHLLRQTRNRALNARTHARTRARTRTSTRRPHARPHTPIRTDLNAHAQRPKRPHATP
jgi:hypothetical protein